MERQFLVPGSVAQSRGKAFSVGGAAIVAAGSCRAKRPYGKLGCHSVAAGERFLVPDISWVMMARVLLLASHKRGSGSGEFLFKYDDRTLPVLHRITW